MTVLPAPESDGVPPLQFEAIDQSLLVDPFQEISAWAGTPRSASQQPKHVVAVTAKRVVSVTEVITMANGAEKWWDDLAPPRRSEYHGDTRRRQ
jgi:hypothetical protein